MKNKLVEILEKHVDAFGFVSVDEYIQTRSSLQKGDLYDDYSLFDGYQTIITLGIPYPSKTVRNTDKLMGLISRYSYGLDYHIVFRRILSNIEEELNQLNIKTLSSVDTGFVDERWASYVANMGFLGKNQFLIHRDLGSYLYLATILIDQHIDKEFTVLDSCGTCDLCVKACPTNALDGKFYMERCISERTQTKRELNEEEIKSIRHLVYGCDICQQVCPKNKGIDVHKYSEFEPNGKEKLDLIKLLDMSNREYKKKYGDNASSWKGATVMKRNAICLLGNRGVIESIPHIKKTMEKHKDLLWYNNVAKKVIKELERKI